MFTVACSAVIVANAVFVASMVSPEAVVPYTPFNIEVTEPPAVLSNEIYKQRLALVVAQ